MKTAKQQALELITVLPDDVPMETLVEELLFKASVLRGDEQSQRGEYVTQEEAKQRFAKWLA